MTRDLQRLAREAFDVLVVGAGIQGAAIAWSAARAGLRTALIDAGDFGSAASANSLKIIHGGLRYLQHGDLRRMRESIRARRRFLHLAPTLVRPLACALPTHGFGTHSRPALAAALALNALISADRNRNLPPASRLPAGRILSPRQLQAHAPGYRLPSGTTGAMLWHDALADDTERLTLGFVLGAARAGACVANYVRALRTAERGAAGTETDIEDLETGARTGISAARVVLAAGPGGEQGLDVPPRPWVMASNLVLRRPLLRDAALAIAGGAGAGDTDALVRRRNRNFFLVPWRGGTLIGTDYRPWPAKQHPRLDREALGDFIRQVNETRAFDPIDIREVVRVHTGLLPAGEDQAAPARRTTIAMQGRILRVQAVKYTTAPEVADTVVRMLLAGGTPPPDEPLPAPPGAEADPDQTVRRAVREEMAVRLSDVVARRTNWADFGRPDAALLARAANVMAALLDWSDARRDRELDEVHRLLDVP